MDYIDVSANTSPLVTELRRRNRRGIVLHETAGVDSLKWLQGASASAGHPASSDYLISRDGTIYQITRPGWIAYHTGTARWQLIQDPGYTLNQSFVGIELESSIALKLPVTNPQYIACAALIRALITYHWLDTRNIVGHYQVALPNGRKRDPLTLDWSILTRELLNPSPEGRAIVFPEALP